jgi:hypothetical protein
MRRFADRRQTEARSAAQALLQGVRERSRLCDCLETAVLENVLAEAERQALVEETRRAWEALAPLDARHAPGFQQRYELASRALGGDARAREELLAALPRNLERRLALCLQMEIAAGLDSPPEFADARMRLQVSRLADALSHRQEGARAGSERLRELLLEWYPVGPAPAASHGALDARIARIVAALG